MHFSFVKPSLHPTRIVSTKKAAKPKFGVQKKLCHDHTPISSQPARDDIDARESRLPLPVQPGLGFALWLRAAGTGARLLLQGSARYVAARWALRTTGVRRSVRIDLLIDNNTLPTWVGASRA